MSACMTPPRVRRMHPALRRAAGFSMVDIAMVLSIVSLIVAGVMLFAMNATESRRQKDALEELADILTIVRGQYIGSPSFDGLTSAVVIGSHQLPAKWVRDPATIANPWGSPVEVVDDTAPGGNSVVSVQFDNLPDPSCFKLATQDLGPSVVQYVLNGTVLPSGPFLPPAAAALCQRGTTNTVSWLFD